MGEMVHICGKVFNSFFVFYNIFQPLAGRWVGRFLS